MAKKYPDAKVLTVTANALAVALSERLTLEEQNIFGNLLALVGASMLSMAAINQANSESGGTADSGAAATAEQSNQPIT